MRRLSVRDVVMPAATVVVVTTVLGLILFGTRALPIIAVLVVAIVGGVGLLVRYSSRGEPKHGPTNGLP